MLPMKESGLSKKNKKTQLWFNLTFKLLASTKNLFLRPVKYYL